MQRIILALRWVGRAILMFVCLTVFHTEAKEPAGKTGAFMWKHETLRSAVQVLYYMPSSSNAQETAPLVVLPGISRKGLRSLNTWKSHADRFGYAVIVPLFDQHDFPGRVYTTGGMLRRDLSVAEPNKWLFSIMDSAVTDISRRLGISAVGYNVFGHSAGAQFAHRLRLFGGKNAQLVVAANSGWYTLPTTDSVFPYGLAGIPSYTSSGLLLALSKPLLLMLGDQDNNPHHRALATDQHAMQQGTNRFARGQFFYSTVMNAASEMAVSVNWNIRIVRGVSHSERGMADAAAPLIARFNQCFERTTLTLCLKEQGARSVSND